MCLRNMILDDHFIMFKIYFIFNHLIKSKIIIKYYFYKKQISKLFYFVKCCVNYVIYIKTYRF